MHSPIVPVFAREQLAADYSQVGLIGMVNYLPYMFAPFFVGILLDRLNKSYVLLSGILIIVFTIFMLCTVQSVLETMFCRALTGVLIPCSGPLPRSLYLLIQLPTGGSRTSVYLLPHGS
jgi:MFS transporter, DHA1 family, inner membrane transport protein